MTVKSPITYYGGKAQLVAWILPILEEYPHQVYIEPFGGGASILLAKRPGFDVYNDIYGDVVNLFKVIRGRDTFPEFQRLVELTPYSREMFEAACEEHQTEGNDIERAALFFVFCRQSFTGKQQGKCPGWRRSRSKEDLHISPAVKGWLSAIKHLPEVHSRLQKVQIDKMDAVECIRRYAEDTFIDGTRRTSLIYCDPPYPSHTRKQGLYRNEMTDEQHAELVRTRPVLVSVPVLRLPRLSVQATLEPLAFAFSGISMVYFGLMTPMDATPFLISCLLFA